MAWITAVAGVGLALLRGVKGFAQEFSRERQRQKEAAAAEGRAIVDDVDAIAREAHARRDPAAPGAAEGPPAARPRVDTPPYPAPGTSGGPGGGTSRGGR